MCSYAAEHGTESERQRSGDVGIKLYIGTLSGVAANVSTFALRSISTNRQNKPEVLPLTEDLKKLKEYLDSEMKSRILAFQKERSSSNYDQLVNVTLTKLISFNKRRSGEAARIELVQYRRFPEIIGLGNREFTETLQPLEKTLCKRLHVLSITGKQGRTVPALLTADLKTAMDLIADNASRLAVGIRPTNVYLFARACKTSVEPFRGCDCIKACALAAKCEKLETMTGKMMRKYVSTVAQVLSLTSNELEWLTGHLGHSADVHKKFYRMHISTIELAKVSKLLIAVHEGRAHEFAGKRMEEIDIDDIP